MGWSVRGDPSETAVAQQAPPLDCPLDPGRGSHRHGSDGGPGGHKAIPKAIGARGRGRLVAADTHSQTDPGF